MGVKRDAYSLTVCCKFIWLAEKHLRLDEYQYMVGNTDCSDKLNAFGNLIPQNLFNGTILIFWNLNTKQSMIEEQIW